MTRVHAFTDDALGDLDAVGLAHELAAGSRSIPEVVEAAIARTERVDSQLGALAYRAYDTARARAADPHGGFFAGVPSFVKDNSDVAGMPTMQGTDMWDPRPARRDGAFARMYQASGMVVLGKTQLSEFGFSGAAEHPRLGPVRSPWDTDRIAGASSSGSAALVAAGAVPIAHANDGGGSIRIPASVNGLVGLKPTRDRVPEDRSMQEMPVRIVADGVITRSVRDTAAFLRESERIWRNPKLPAVGDVRGPGERRLRIGLVTRSVDREASPEVVALVRDTGRRLEALGHHVEEIDPPVPAYFPKDFLVYWSVLSFALLSRGRKDHGPSFDAAKADNLTRGLRDYFVRNVARFPLATARLGASRYVNDRAHRDYDVFLTPTLAHETPLVGHLDPMNDFATVIDRLMDWVAFTPLQNATGAPSLSLPLARTASQMPQGMCFSAAYGHDATLLELAYELEQAYPWERLDQVR